MSFFDDGEETAPRPAARSPRRPGAGGQGTSSSTQRPRPRRPQRGGSGYDHHTVMVRRRVAAAVAVVVLIVIVLIVNGVLKSQKQQSLKSYNHNVGVLAEESDAQVSKPLFTALTDAAAKSALDVEEQVDQLRLQMQKLTERVAALSVPGEMAGAQQDLLLTFHLRSEAMTKLANLLPSALGGQGSQAMTKIAGDMEIFLASDVIYAQRVAPLIQQTLSAAGIQGLTTAPTRFLPNTGWLSTTTVSERISGQTSSSSQTGPVTGNHGSALKAVAVGTNTLAEEPTLNHLPAGNTTFTATVENSGEFNETNVKVDVTVTSAGKQYKASHVILKTEPGKSVNVEIPVQGVPSGPAKIEVMVEGVPGENDLENNKGTYLAIFGE